MSTTSHFVSSTAIPLLLTIPPLYFVYSLLFPSVALPTANSQLATSHHDSYNWAPTTGPKTLLLRDYTPKELAQFDGKGGDGRILLAIKGQVFDVSAGRNFYGPDGAYGNFAGRDASRGMAKQSFDEDMLTPADQPIDTLSDLTPSEIENMDGWVEHFQRKYTICGKLVPNS